MAINRQYIFNKVAILLKNETRFFTSAEIHSIIGVDSFRRIASDIQFPKTNYSSAMVSGAYTVSMPSNFVKVDKESDITFEDSTGIRKLTPKTKKVLGRDQILSATPSSPENYFMENQSSLGIYPPCTSGTIVVPYVNRPTSLSSDTDTNELTEEGYMASVYYTLLECMEKDNDQRYALYEGKYQQEIRRLRGIYDERFDVDEALVPDNEYIRR